MIKAINQVVAFSLEIIMLIAYGYFGMTRPWSLILRLLFTIAIILITILLWAIWAAPKAARRLNMPYLVIFRAAMFLLAAFFLYASGYKNLALIITALTVISQLISYATEK